MQSKSCIVPSFLIWLKSENEDTELQLSQYDEEKRHANFNNIIQIKKQEEGIKSEKDTFLTKYLLEKLKKVWSELSIILNRISSLSWWQQKILSDTIDKKISRNRELSNHISSLRNKRKTIDQIYWYIHLHITIEFPLLLNNLIELESKSEDIEKDIISLEKEFNDFKELNPEKNKANISKFEYYARSIKNKKRELRRIEEKIEDLHKEIEKLRSDYTRQLISVISNERHKESFEILNRLWGSNKQDVMLDLKQICSEESKSIESDIVLAEWELESHITIYLKKRKENFYGRNLYSELYWEWQDIDIDKLKSLLSSWLFSIQDSSFIEEQLDLLWLDTPRKEREKAEKELKKYFKSKSNENNDLWIDTTISIDEINRKFLKLLSSIFEHEYFVNHISVQFDIYLFFKSKSKKDIKKYIEEKYDLSKLKWINKDLEQYNEVIDELEYLWRILDWLEGINEKAKDRESIDEIAFWIYSTRVEFENILDKHYALK